MHRSLDWLVLYCSLSKELNGHLAIRPPRMHISATAEAIPKIDSGRDRVASAVFSQRSPDGESEPGCS